MQDSLSMLRERLNDDTWRRQNGFSEDIEIVNSVLNNPLALDPERASILGDWLQKRSVQPCVFGKLAASTNRLHYCFLTTKDLAQSDDHIRTKISESRKKWKYRALYGIREHGFVLAVCDEKVAYAMADEELRQFSLHLQRLAGWVGRPDTRGNDVVDEWLYLKHPTTAEILRFTFSVDFFASAADRKWWHDHRVPGGLAFTANSLGHMTRSMEWHEHRTGRISWALKTAMNTIDIASTEYLDCPATYLVDLENGRPSRAFTWREAEPLPQSHRLAGKDCGSYKGHLHTDHAIRAEFFAPDANPAYKEHPYIMDFTYIFDTDSIDNQSFMAGVRVTADEVEADLGPIGDLEIFPAQPATLPANARSREADSIDDVLARTREWRLTKAEIDDLL